MQTHAKRFSIDACLDPEAMRTLLRQALPDAADGHVVLDRLRVVSARRSASRQRNPHPLTLRYEVDVHDDATGRTDTLRLYGKVYRGGASAAAAHDRPVLHIPQLDMLLWAWPADPGLPQLPHLMDLNQTQRWWGEPAREVSVLRYEPEQRATLCYTRNTKANANSGVATRLYAKTFCDDRAEAIYRRFAHFWEMAQHHADAPLVAQPLGYCAQTRSFWQAQAEGKPLSQGFMSGLAPALAERLAQAIAAVHAAPHALAGPAPHDTAHWLSEIRRRRQKITRAAPELAGRIARVAEALEQSAVLMPAYPLTVIHGDYHPGQVWLAGRRVVLFDFDEFTLGDPMEDLAAFVVRLGQVPTDSAFAAQLLTQYSRIAPAHFCAQRLQWHLVVQQVLQASRAFVFQVKDWRRELERRVARAEALCASTELRFLQ
jgi:aminoglycoside phosphotransferase (APT) family kinase protein